MANRVLQSLKRFPLIFAPIQTGKSLQNIQNECRQFSILNSWKPPTITAGTRTSSFRSSDLCGDISDHPEVEIFRNPPEWVFVERILSPALVPEPKSKSEYPSGWKPTNIDKTIPYSVQRTKNHMIPVYLSITYRGSRHVTKLRKIHGDIWALEAELRPMIEARIGKKIITKVNEMIGQIWFKGDYVTLIQEYLMKKGF